MGAAVKLLLISMALLALFKNSSSQNNDPSSLDESDLYQDCSCTYVPEKEGCKLADDKLAFRACQCSIDATNATNCIGRIVKCADPTSSRCTSSGNSFDYCMQGVWGGKGNCCGYKDAVPDCKDGIVITCDCVRQIKDVVMPGVDAAINELSSAVNELFDLVGKADISPVGVRHFCIFFCNRIRTYRQRVHHHPWQKHHYHHCDHHKCHHCGYHCPHCCKTHRWRRQADASLPAAVCPIEEFGAVEISAKEGTDLVQEVIASIRADPGSVSQELLDDVTGLYNDVNESVKNLQLVLDIDNGDCSGNTKAAAGVAHVVGDVAFGG